MSPSALASRFRRCRARSWSAKIATSGDGLIALGHSARTASVRAAGDLHNSALRLGRGGRLMKVFVSYSHKQAGWVGDRLVPVLKAGGVEVLIDRERFKAGLAVVGQMDTLQDQGESHVLCLSTDYYASPPCVHEMTRAIATDA